VFSVVLEMDAVKSVVGESVEVAVVGVLVVFSGGNEVSSNIISGFWALARGACKLLGFVRLQWCICHAEFEFICICLRSFSDCQFIKASWGDLLEHSHIYFVCNVLFV